MDNSDFNNPKFPYVSVSCGMILLLVAVFLATEIMGGDNTDPNPSSHYCEMTEIHHESAGEYGWPDYKDTAQYCDWQQE